MGLLFSAETESWNAVILEAEEMDYFILNIS